MQVLCRFFRLCFRRAVPPWPNPVTLRELSRPKMGDYVGHVGLLRESATEEEGSPSMSSIQFPERFHSAKTREKGDLSPKN